MILLLQAIDDILSQEISVCKDILALEDTAAPHGKVANSIKWPTLTLAQLQELSSSIFPVPSGGDELNAPPLYQRLQDIDQLRAGFYADASQGSAKILVQSAG